MPRYTAPEIIPQSDKPIIFVRDPRVAEYLPADVNVVQIYEYQVLSLDYVRCTVNQTPTRGMMEAYIIDDKMYLHCNQSEAVCLSLLDNDYPEKIHQAIRNYSSSALKE